MPSPRNAAPWMWGLSALLLPGGCCMGLMSLPFLLSDTAIMRDAFRQSDLPADQLQAINNHGVAFGAVFIGVGVVGLIASLVIAGLAIGVFRGSHASTRVARWVVLAALLALAGISLFSLPGTLMQGQVGPLIFSVIALGTPTAVAAIATAKLFGAGSSAPPVRGGYRADDDEPWNAHLR
ncbi:MAG: hypothetical protein AAGK09_00160 [Planctomycetota bacterium]